MTAQPKAALSLYPVTGLPEIREGCDLVRLLADALAGLDLSPLPGDVLVVTHKIVSKAFGRVRRMEDIAPGEDARRLAQLTGKDPRSLQAILDSSTVVYGCERHIVIAERPDGWICANAGIDESNAGGKGRLILLPPDCDALAGGLSRGIGGRFGSPLPVLICDTHGRALRNGAVGVCVGSAGLAPVRSYSGQADRDGRILQHTQEAVADELAAAATFVMGQGDEGIPAVLIRGTGLPCAQEDSGALRRPSSSRLYRINAEICVDGNAGP